jgi:hypothetical protein
MFFVMGLESVNNILDENLSKAIQCI